MRFPVFFLLISSCVVGRPYKGPSHSGFGSDDPRNSLTGPAHGEILLAGGRAFNPTVRPRPPPVRPQPPPVQTAEFFDHTKTESHTEPQVLDRHWAVRYHDEPGPAHAFFKEAGHGRQGDKLRWYRYQKWSDGDLDLRLQKPPDGLALRKQ